MSNEFDNRNELIRLKSEKIKQLQEEISERRRRPHRWLQKLYSWQREFMDSTAKIQVLTAANQCGKSSTMIKKTIEWATNEELWPLLWPERMRTGQPPTQFWYLYPSAQMALAEFFDKWVPLLPPKDDPELGWKEVKVSGKFLGICFLKTRLYIYFKTYSQNIEHLQAGTAYMVTCFVDGTMVTTARGDVPIEQVTADDMVLTRDGFKKVSSTKTREAEVIKATFSNGSILEGTPDHKIWTINRGWVPLGSLKTDDICVDVPVWKKQKEEKPFNGRKLKLSYLMDLFLLGSQTLKTLVVGTTLSVLSLLNHLFIKPFTVLHTALSVYLRDFIFITSTSTHSTTGSIIYRCSRWKSTTPFIKKLSGQTESSKNLFALFVKKHTPLAVVVVTEINTALSNAVKKAIETLCRATGAVKNLLEGVTLKHKSSALYCVQIEAFGKIKKVNCLTVQEKPEYFANGILAHNCDEEVGEAIVPELQMRVHATNGYIIFGFTATLGQIFWREIVEERKRWKDAWVKQVPLWDCMKYEDGTPTAWTKARIEHAIANCTTEAEVQRRIYGRFVKDEGLKFSHYSDMIHMRLWKPVPKDWKYYVGIDWGVGANAATGRSGHPSGIVFVAINPENTEAVVERSWRGDGLSYTCQDLVELYLQMSVDIKDQIARVFYDWSAGDIGTVAMRRGLSFERADKDRERGVSIINSLLKMRRISFYRHHGSCDIPAEWVQGEKIHDEFSSLPVGNEGSMLNELADSIRYALISVPFDWDKMREIVRNLGGGILSKASDVDQHQAQLINGVWLRAGEEFIKTAMGEDILEELEFWNETFQD